MKGEEYRKLRHELELTQVQLAHALELDPGTVARRERDEAPIDQEAELAIRALVDADYPAAS